MKERAPKPSGVQKTTGRPILIVEDDPHVARAVARLVPSPDNAVIVNSLAEARGALATGTTFRAAVVDIGLPDGSGLDVVRRLREGPVTVPVLVLTAQLDRALVNDVHELEAEFVCKPDFATNLEAFFERIQEARERSPIDEESVELVVAELALTPRECDIVRLSMSGVPRGRLAEVMGISRDGVDKHRDFVAKHNLTFHALSDPEGRVHRLFRIKDTIPFLVPGRETFVIDRDGVIRHHFASQINATKHVDEALRVVRELQSEREAAAAASE